MKPYHQRLRAFPAALRPTQPAVLRAALFAALSAVLLVTALSCAKDKPSGPGEPPPDPFVERRTPAAIADDVAAAVTANNAFAFDVYHATAGAPGNLLLAPYSISTAFAMVWAGARDQTASEIAAVFHFDAAGDSLHPACGALRRSLDRGNELGSYQVRTANRLWGQNGETFEQAFLDITRIHYGAEMGLVDFRSDPEGIRGAINGWVFDHTAGRIPELFPPSSIGAMTRLVLANAVYFKGAWQDPFDPANTRDRAFTLPGGTHVSVPMMERVGEVPYGEFPGGAFVALPYGGRDIDMVILLPSAADGLPALESTLDAQVFASWTSMPADTEVTIVLPRFEFAGAVDLGDVLPGMGMPTAFSDAADFTGIRASGGLSITGAFHKTWIRTDEEGSEAAGATGVVVGETSAPLTARFVADHPFLFAIRDRVTGSILFLGRVADPRG